MSSFSRDLKLLESICFKTVFVGRHRSLYPRIDLTLFIRQRNITFKIY